MKKSVFCIFAVFFLATILFAENQPNSTAASTKLNSAVFDWAKLKSEQKAYGERRSVFDNSTDTLANFECHITTLSPGESSGSAHTHTAEEVLFVKDGTIEVEINGMKKSAGPGSIVYFAPTDITGVRNVSTRLATYAVFSIQVARIKLSK